MSDLFYLKTESQHCTVVALCSTNIDAFSEAFTSHTKQAPLMFKETLIILDLLHLNATLSVTQLQLLQTTISNCYATLIGFKNASKMQIKIAMQVGLANIQTKKRSTKSHEPRPVQKKIVNHRIRSGQQIYAKHTDLIVLGDVSPGAEIIADGDIHVYGKLSGKALAGAHNSPTSQIYCGSFNPELISIAGIFLTAESIEVAFIGRSVVVSLEEQAIKFNVIN